MLGARLVLAHAGVDQDRPSGHPQQEALVGVVNAITSRLIEKRLHFPEVLQRALAIGGRKQLVGLALRTFAFDQRRDRNVAEAT